MTSKSLRYKFQPMALRFYNIFMGVYKRYMPDTWELINIEKMKKNILVPKIKRKDVRLDHDHD